MSTAGLKKTDDNVDNSAAVLELDELYWFIGRKPRTETRENVYIMTMVSRQSRQIVGWAVSLDKTAHTIQEMVDGAPEAELYCTDGYVGYMDVIYPGRHVRNTHDKSDTYTVEGINADLRHYIPILARRSRCFARRLETLRAVMEVFVDAYNRFGRAKQTYRLTHERREVPFGIVDFL
jgi:IS1 family transposase